MKKVTDKKKLFMIVSICILCITLIGGTLAYYRTVLFADLNVGTITHGLDYYITYVGGQNIDSATLERVSDYTETTSSTEITFYKNDNTYDIYGHIYLDINSIGEATSQSSALKYTVVNSTTGAKLSEGTLAGSKTNDSVLIASNIPLQTTEELFKIYIWIDENEDINPAMEGETLSLTVRCEATMKKIATGLVDYISNLYNSAEKSEVTNNNITYNYATSVNLMNDRLGGTTDSYDAGNIRYYGSNPNNYIDIGDVYTEDTVINNMEKNNFLVTISGVTDEKSCHEFFDCDTNYSGLGNLLDIEFADAAACKKVFDYESTDEMCGTVTKKAGDPVLYRIIGLFKDVELSSGQKTDLIKVIREDSIGNFAWDLTSADEQAMTYDNNWHDATLNNILNNGYLKSSSGIIHYYYDMLTGSPATATTDFTKIGISPMQNKVAEVVWNLGGWDDDAYPNEIYEYERGESKCTDCTYETTWEGKVALAYPSDQGYGADLSNCSSTLSNYILCNSVNWMSSMSNGTVIEWLLAPYSSYSDDAWNVSFGGVGYGSGVAYGFGARPVFYLSSELAMESGSGTKTNPYVVR